jgi:hypothetical protein
LLRGGDVDRKNLNEINAAQGRSGRRSGLGPQNPNKINAAQGAQGAQGWLIARISQSAAGLARAPSPTFSFLLLLQMVPTGWPGSQGAITKWSRAVAIFGCRSVR